MRSWRWPVGSFNSFNPCVGNSEQPPSRDLNVGSGPVLVFVGNARDHESPRSKKGRWAQRLLGRLDLPKGRGVDRMISRGLCSLGKFEP